MFHIVLYEPEIPPNTGNIIRLCANTGCTLHLVEPLGFKVDDKHVKRAGLDYHCQVVVNVHPHWAACKKALGTKRLFALSSKVATNYCTPQFTQDDVFVFGPESRGLPAEVLQDFSEAYKLTIPQQTTTRSLNLSNAAAIMVYEAWRQVGFV